MCRITRSKILRNIWGVGVFELRVGLTIQGGVNFPRVGLYPSSELWNCSFDMPSLIDDPLGWDKSMINLTDPSFLGAEPMGEQ